MDGWMDEYAGMSVASWFFLESAKKKYKGNSKQILQGAPSGGMRQQLEQLASASKRRIYYGCRAITESERKWC